MLAFLLNTGVTVALLFSIRQVINVIVQCVEVVDKILIFAVLKRWLLQQGEIKASFVFDLFYNSLLKHQRYR